MKRQELAKVFSREITKFQRERIISLYKDERRSADLVDKSCLSKYKIDYKFLLTVIDLFIKLAWAIPLMKKSGVSLTNGFKTILLESRTPEKLWVDWGGEFYDITLNS